MSNGVIIEQKGPNGWAVMGAGGLIGLALVIIALALWNLSMYAGIGLIILAMGQGAFLVQRGTALIIEARGRAAAMQQEARTRWLATMRGKALIAGPKAREDMRALWPGEDL